MIEALGWVSTFLLSVCNFAQVHKTLRRRKVDDVSVLQWVLLNLGFVTGLAYAIGISAWPVVVGQFVGIGTSGFFIYLYFKFRRPENV